MRILLVGSPVERARLRAQLDGSMDVAGEFESLAAAQAVGGRADAIVVAPDVPELDHDAIGVREGTRPARAEQSGALSWDERDGPQEPLTPREIQVLELLAEGLPNKAIAARLRISDQTVKFHVSSISGKLGAANRTDAVRRAVRRGLITL
jgi:ATP/maltotriose-dependent transcriptional regulator MalT